MFIGKVTAWTSQPTIRKIQGYLLPWVAFGILWNWSWRISNPFLNIPAYGDALEVLWGIQWYGNHIFDGSLWINPQIFYPAGWHISSFAHAPFSLIPLLPFYYAGGAAFAYNMSLLLASIAGFGGSYRLTHRWTRSQFYATLAALLFTFWTCRWIRTHGHQNVLWGSSLLLWIALAMDRALTGAPRLLRRRLIQAGALWGLAIAIQLYYLWIGGFVILSYCLGYFPKFRSQGKVAFLNLGLIPTVALLLSSPAIWIFAKGQRSSGAELFNLVGTDYWSASLNSLPIPSIYHPWLATFAQKIYQGPLDESSIANLGLIASLLVLIVVFQLWRTPKWRPALFLTGTGILLTLGYTLHWDGYKLQLEAARPLNTLLWNIGHLLKPNYFTSATPPEGFATAIPLPSLWLAALVPFWEGARTLSRYIFIAGVSFFPLVVESIRRLPHWILRAAAIILVLIEIVPPPTGNLPAEPSIHPAHAWILENAQPQDAILDLQSLSPHQLQFWWGGETIWATLYHKRPIVSGAGSLWPSSSQELEQWLFNHPDPFKESDFVYQLRTYGVRYILLHEKFLSITDFYEQAGTQADFRPVQCFQPAPGLSPWAYPICIIEIKPSSHQNLNLQFREGWTCPNNWSNCMEDWGIWAEGKYSVSQWFIPQVGPMRLSLTAFPNCDPQQPQAIALQVNGHPLATHTWTACEEWNVEIPVPAEWLHEGWNDLRMDYGYAARPVDLTQGANSDPRLLSVGFSRLQINPIPLP